MSSATALLLFVLSITLSDAARILALFPVPSISHQVVFRPLTQELSKRGHEVTVITPDPAFPKGETLANFTEIDVHDFSSKKWNSVYEVTSTGDYDLVAQMKFAFNMIAEVVEMNLQLDVHLHSTAFYFLLRTFLYDLKTFLDSSKNGVIYINFGSNVKSSFLPPDRVQLMVKVFSQLPYDVLWKWDQDELPGRSKNIRITKWLPQSDLLRHPKIKVNILQGGLQSTNEAITAGVPLIGVPMLGDQWYNVEKFEHHGIGVKLDFHTMAEEGFRNTIETVIGDKSFRYNIAKLGSVMRDQPTPPLERAVWWTEHVLRHGAAGGARHLRSPATNMSWTEYLELVLTVSAIALFSVLVFTFIVFIFCVFIVLVVDDFMCVSSGDKIEGKLNTWLCF